MSESPEKARPAATPQHDDGGHSVMAKPSPVVAWVWFVLKNLIGWVLIIGAFPLGALIPGPGGIPLFLIGFGLITFPGKRHFTARLMRGHPVRSDSGPYRFAITL